MSKEISSLNRFLIEGPQSVLERTLFAEYLICEGYLVSDLDQMPSGVAQNLMMNALQFVALRLDDMEFNDKFPYEIRFAISLN